MEGGDILYDQLSDSCFFAKTKLDGTFNQNCFNMPDNKSFRNDRNAAGGGLLAYARSCLPASLRPDLEHENPEESKVIDVTINNRKWAVFGAYRPPSVDSKLFSNIAVKGTDKIITHFDNIILLGDLNYDSQDKNKGSALLDLCNIFDFRNLIEFPTCFMKSFIPSLVDVILTNQPQFYFNAFNFRCDVSDCHNFIEVGVKGSAPKTEKQKKEV